MGRILWTLVVVTIGAAACSQSPRSADSRASPPIDDGWVLASPEDAGFDRIALDQLTQDLGDGAYPNLHAVLIEHNGRLVYEHYLDGEDERWGAQLGRVTFDAGSLHDLRSVTKSVTSLLLGIALGSDFDEALDHPLVSYFPELEGRFGDGVEQVTLRHAMTMTAGLEWNEMTVPYTDPNNDEIRLYYTDDPVALVLARPVLQGPGEEWYYNGGLTQVVAGVIEHLTGKSLDRFAEESLFEPLGITDYEWLGSRAWPAGSSPSAASGLRLRARDLAKIGSLVLHDGVWKGERIVPAGWIELSTQRLVPHIPWSTDGVYGYGFMWYPGQSKGPRGTQIIRAAGNGDQRLFILPEHRIVVTIYSGLYNRFDVRNGKHILARVIEAHDPDGHGEGND